MDYLGQHYHNKKDLPQLFKTIHASNFEKSLEIALNGLAEPNYEMLQFILNFHPKENVDKKVLFNITQTKHPKLSAFIKERPSLGSISLNVEQLAGLVNANEGHFFTPQSLIYNALSFNHNEFEKNLTHFPIPFDYSEKKLSELNSKLFIETLKNTQYAKHYQNYAILIQYYLKNIENKESGLSIWDRQNLYHSPFLDLEFFKVALKENLIEANTPIIFHKESPPSSPLDVACLYSNLDIIQYLVETLNVDIAKFFNKEFDRDIVLSTLLDVRYNTDKILDYLFERFDYDFNKNYRIACSVNKNSKSPGYMYLEIMNITEYVEYHRSNTQLTGEKKEVYDAQCDNVQRVIEKHKLEALIKVNNKDKSSEKNNKIKL